MLLSRAGRGCGRGLLAFWSTLAAGPPAAALDPGKALTQYVHETWSGRDGLPQSSIQAIAQTADGYLWLGTQAGLVRFDGVRFTVFDRTNTDALKSANVLSLLADHQGTLWIGTFGGGLVRYRGGRFLSVPEGTDSLHPIVKCLSRGTDGALWVGTFGGGLARLAGGRTTRYTVREGLAHDGIRSLLLSRHGAIWIGTDVGLNRLQDGRFTLLGRRDGLPHNSVLSLLEDREGTLWIGTARGLHRLAGPGVGRVPIHPALRGAVVRVLYEDRHGSLWVGTDRDGLWRLAYGRWESLSSADGLSSNFVYSIFEDREGSLWLGTYTGGLNRLKDTAATTYGPRQGLPADITWSVLEGRDGSIWMATLGAGLVRLRHGAFTQLTTRTGLSTNMTFSLLEDSRGRLWAGTSGGGLNLVEDGRVKAVFTTAQGLCNDVVLSLAEDRAGGIWIGTQGGLGRLEGGRLECHRAQAGGLPHEIVRALRPAPDGALWIGTWGGGLSRLQDGVFRSYTTRDGLASDIVESLYLDPEGTLWIGTQGGGLNRFAEGRFTTYTTRHGLPSDTAFEILEDRSGHLWFGSPNGIVRVPKKDLEAVAAGAAASLGAARYGEGDGMASSVCNGRSQPAGWKAADGRLWFPTQKGVVVVDPARIRANLLAPPVVIEQVLADNAPLAPGGRAPAGSRAFEFRYTGLSLLTPSRVLFRHRLEGIDTDWVTAGTRRVAHYTNVPAGTHTFRVIACNDDGFWNETGDAFTFTIPPRFHQTRGFYALILSAAVLAGVAFHRARVAYVEAKAAVLDERNRIAQDIHDGLAQALGGIIIQLEVAAGLLDDPRRDGSRAAVGAARALAQQSLEEARRSVWGLRPALLEEGGLATAVRRVLEQLTAGTGVEVDFQVHGPPRPLPEGVEVALLRIAQEAVFNAIRHARPRHVRVALAYGRRAVELRVVDDGAGIDASSVAGNGVTGFGIPGMRLRVARRGGEFTIQRHAVRGTEVSVSLPTGRGPLLGLRSRLRRVWSASGPA